MRDKLKKIQQEKRAVLQGVEEGLSAIYLALYEEAQEKMDVMARELMDGELRLGRE